MNRPSRRIASTTTAGRQRKPKIQVIARAMAIMRSLEREPDGLSLGGIAQRLKLPRSTVQRIVSALETEHLLIAASPNGGVKLGPAVLRLAASVDISAQPIAKPYMLELAQEFGETVVLSALGRDHAVFVDQAIGSRLFAISAITDKFPLFCTAAGKAILALMADVDIEEKYGTSFEARTPRTRTTLKALLADIHLARRTGVACVTEEHTQGVCALAIGFRDGMGNKMAISMPIPSSRFEDLREPARKRLLALRSILIKRFKSP